MKTKLTDELIEQVKNLSDEDKVKLVSTFWLRDEDGSLRHKIVFYTGLRDSEF